jgi:hypothetical protein
MMHKYWVRYRIVFANDSASDAAMEVTRQAPICGGQDLAEIAAVIGQTLQKSNQLPADSKGVAIVSWQKFESIILTH